jgi:hypothetical protein
MATTIPLTELLPEVYAVMETENVDPLDKATLVAMLALCDPQDDGLRVARRLSELSYWVRICSNARLREQDATP